MIMEKKQAEIIDMEHELTGRINEDGSTSIDVNFKNNGKNLPEEKNDKK